MNRNVYFVVARIFLAGVLYVYRVVIALSVNKYNSLLARNGIFRSFAPRRRLTFTIAESLNKKKGIRFSRSCYQIY